MSSIRSTLWSVFKSVRRGFVMLLLAPFIALSAFFGFVTLAMGYFLRGFERLFGLVGAEPDFGSQFLINAGVKQLPTFNRGVLKR